MILKGFIIKQIRDANTKDFNIVLYHQIQHQLHVLFALKNLRFIKEQFLDRLEKQNFLSKRKEILSTKIKYSHILGPNIEHRNVTSGYSPFISSL